MDTFKIGVSIVLANSIAPALTALASKFIGMNNTVSLLNKNLGSLKQIGLGVAGVLGGVAMFEGMAKLAQHGVAVNHQLELMKMAGMQNQEIQDSLAAAMRVSSSNMTTHLSENLAHIRELRYAFGETTTAVQHLDEISKANTILNAVKGGGHDQVWELVKALEGKGLTFDSAAFSSYVNTMTKVVQASGGRVTPQQYFGTFKYGRTATLGWDEEFVGGALPRLIQSMAAGKGGTGGGGGGPGNALMTAFGAVVHGQMSKTQAEQWAALGLTPGGIQHIKGSSRAQIVGGIAGKDQFMANPYEWVQTTLMPALAKRGITEQNRIIEVIAKLFPIRTASQVIAEMGLQGRFHEGENSPFEKDIKLQKGAMGLLGFDELIKNDYPTVMKAFHTQFKNLLEVLGSPLIQPGGPVMIAMARLTSVMNSMATFAAAHPEGLKVALEIFTALAGGLVVGGLVALGTAIGGLLGVSGIIFGLAAAFAALAAFNWESLSPWLQSDSISQQISKMFDGIKTAIGSLAGIAWQGVVSMFDGITKAISGFLDAITGLYGKALNLLGIDKGGSGTSPGKTGHPWHPTNFDPGTGKIKAQPISLSLNVDGRTLAQSISEQLEYLYEHATGAPSYDGNRRFIPADGGMMGT